MISPGRDMANFHNDGNRTKMNVKIISTSAEKRMIQSYGSGLAIGLFYFYQVNKLERVSAKRRCHCLL
jgi:hypothetical protein